MTDLKGVTANAALCSMAVQHQSRRQLRVEPCLALHERPHAIEWRGSWSVPPVWCVGHLRVAAPTACIAAMAVAGPLVVLSVVGPSITALVASHVSLQIHLLNQVRAHGDL